MRTQDGVFCDGKSQTCRKPATRVHNCKIENSEFAFCKMCDLEFQELTRGKAELQIRCPRCIPGFLATKEGQLANRNVGVLPDPITGVLARAIDEAMYRQGVLAPDRVMVLRRLAAVDDTYVRALFRSTADPVVKHGH